MCVTSTFSTPIIPEHEHGLGASGLRRIRQHPQAARTPGLQTGASTTTTAANSRSASMNFSIPPTRRTSASLPSGPGSPTLNFSEDLTRFPSESLHSFSFAHQSEEFIHNRQNVLKRSIDFMSNKLGWAGSNPAIAAAQAKLSGDQEVLSVMELLNRAQLIGSDASSGIAGGWGGLGQGPITGPADVSGENVFERGFMGSAEADKSESPVEMEHADKVGHG
jgi:protein-serine/threonine kinase